MDMDESEDASMVRQARLIEFIASFVSGNTRLRNWRGGQSDFPGKAAREGPGSSLHLAVGSQPLRDAQLQRSQDSCLLWLGPGDPTQGQFPAICRLQEDVTDLDLPQLPQDDLWRHRPWFGETPR